jgi:mRNA interferase MazF
LRRGEIWTAAGGAVYATKPRPVLIIQADEYRSTDSVVVCPITSEPASTKFLRPPLEPNSENGLLSPSRIMVDKVAALPRTKLRDRVGQVQAADVLAIETALMTFLGVAR